MEVLSFFSNNNNIIHLFDEFISQYQKLNLKSCTDDSKYYSKPGTIKNEIYFHFVPDDIDKEFSYNYSSNEQKIIKESFNNSEIILFDIQYRDEVFVEGLLKDFIYFLKNQITDQQKLLISHPKKGIVQLL